jgi:hypothetical protein
MKHDFSLRGRLISAMLLVFTLGLGASAALYYLEVRADRQDLRERTLEEQASDLLAGLRFGKDGKAKFALPDDWADAYTTASSGFYFTHLRCQPKACGGIAESGGAVAVRRALQR